MADSEYWIWLLRTLGSTVKSNVLIKHYANARNVYLAGKDDWLSSGLLTSADIGKLSKYSPSESFSVMKACADNGWHILTQEDEFFPKKLKEIKDCPLVLFAEGNPQVLNLSPSIGIVGTRNASDKASVAAYRLSMFLSRAGVCVVSGGAVGIDSCAHEGALEAKCPTVAVLGNGLGHTYLSSLKSMRERIKSNGVLVSEMLPFEEPSRFSFPKRNRIISGMCDGVAVIEAAQKSGSLITASHAISQKRDVFALSKDVLFSSGCEKLIKEQGAVEIRTAADIVEKYKSSLAEKNADNRYINTPLAEGQISESYIIKIRNMPEREYRREFAMPVMAVNKNAQKIKKEEKPLKKEFARQSEQEPIIQKEKVLVLPDTLSEDAKAVYRVLTKDGIYPDEIEMKTNLGTAKILTAVTELELEDLAVLLTGNKVAKV